MMNSRISSLVLLKLLSKHSCVPSAASGKATRPWPSRAPAQVCLRSIWLSTYSRRPALRSTSPRSSLAFSPASASPSIARAWSRLLPKRSPAAIVFCAPKRIPSVCARTRDDTAVCFSLHRRGLVLGVSPETHFCPRCPPGARHAGLPGPEDPDARHLGGGAPGSELERRISAAFPLPVGTSTVVSAGAAARFGVLPATTGGRRHRRHPLTKNGPRDRASLLSTRSFVAALSRQPDAGPAFSAGFLAGSFTSQCPGRHARLADSLSGSLARQASLQEGQPGDAATLSRRGETA